MRRFETVTSATLPTLLLLLYILCLPLMQPTVALFGFDAVAADFLFAMSALAFALLFALRRTAIVADRAYAFIAAYLVAMLVSAAFADAPLGSAAKLLTQLYLLGIPLLVCSLVRDERTLRAAIFCWIVGAGLVAGVAVVSLLLFAVDPAHPLLGYTRYHFGTLPPGNYPRLQLTFLNANLACNYLTVSLALLLAARKNGWVARWRFVLLMSGILLAAAVTISPGLGGIALALGLWLWLLGRNRQVRVARLFLIAGGLIALCAVAAMALTPIVHATAPFVVQLPLLDVALAPSGRLLVWIDAFRNFAADPVVGRGIGSEAVMVRYADPSGNLQELTDAHNMFLSIAVQCGIIGLAALVCLIAHALRRTLPLRLPESAAGVIRLGAGLGLLNGLVYQGLGGSFEDARHLWLALGLLLASDRIEKASRSGSLNSGDRRPRGIYDGRSSPFPDSP